MSQTLPDERLIKCYKGVLTDEALECQAVQR